MWNYVFDWCVWFFFVCVCVSGVDLWLRSNNWDWNWAIESNNAWVCPHCQGICPERAQCAIYRRTNERRREQQLMQRTWRPEDMRREAVANATLGNGQFARNGNAQISVCGGGSGVGGDNGAGNARLVVAMNGNDDGRLREDGSGGACEWGKTSSVMGGARQVKGGFFCSHFGMLSRPVHETIATAPCFALLACACPCYALCAWCCAVRVQRAEEGLCVRLSLALRSRVTREWWWMQLTPHPYGIFVNLNLNYARKGEGGCGGGLNHGVQLWPLLSQTYQTYIHTYMQYSTYMRVGRRACTLAAIRIWIWGSRAEAPLGFWLACMHAKTHACWLLIRLALTGLWGFRFWDCIFCPSLFPPSLPAPTPFLFFLTTEVNWERLTKLHVSHTHENRLFL